MKATRIILGAFTIAALAATLGCGSVVRDSRAPVMLVIDLLQAIRGAVGVGQPTGSLQSDVLTIVTTGGTCTVAAPCPTVFGDIGRVTLHMVLKDIGQPGTTLTPSTNNQVTMSRIHVAYRRTDGRNQEGVDVPYSYDTASTALVPQTGVVLMDFPLVRIQAKQSTPLLELVTNGQIISTIADVTFYGADVVGNAISVTGSINIDFGNFGDF